MCLQARFLYRIFCFWSSYFQPVFMQRPRFDLIEEVLGIRTEPIRQHRQPCESPGVLLQNPPLRIVCEGYFVRKKQRSNIGCKPFRSLYVVWKKEVLHPQLQKPAGAALFGRSAMMPYR